MNARKAWVATLALLAVILFPLVAASQATGDEEPVDLEKIRLERKKVQHEDQLGSRLQRYLAAAGKAFEEGKAEEGLALLDRLNPKRLNRLELAYVYRLRATLSYEAGNYDEAIEYFEKTLGQEALPLDAENQIRFSIAQIQASLEHWKESIAALKRWFRYVEDPDPLAYYLMGIAYYRLEDLDAAVANTRKAVDLAPEPREGWLQLLSALYIEKEDYKSATPILEDLLIRFPKKQYWVQLSLIYGARNDYRVSLAVQQVAYLQGLLTEDKELRRLARSYLYNDLPYPAAKVLEKGLADGAIEPDAESYELLANSWIAAREYDRSLAPLQKAAQLSDNGNLYVRLGQVHLQREEWSQAAEQLQKAVAKGGLDNPGNAQLLLGIAYYNDKRVGQARSSFARAREYASTREKAETWLTHIDNESRAG
jgi:tetratricopeptide (TPR) repeat protein